MFPQNFNVPKPLPKLNSGTFCMGPSYDLEQFKEQTKIKNNSDVQDPSFNGMPNLGANLGLFLFFII